MKPSCSLVPWWLCLSGAEEFEVQLLYFKSIVPFFIGVYFQFPGKKCTNLSVYSKLLCNFVPAECAAPLTPPPPTHTHKYAWRHSQQNWHRQKPFKLRFTTLKTYSKISTSNYRKSSFPISPSGNSDGPQQGMCFKV